MCDYQPLHPYDRFIVERYCTVDQFDDPSSPFSHLWQAVFTSNSLWRDADLWIRRDDEKFNPLNAELNPIRHLLALVAVRHIVHVSRIRVKHHSE